MIERTINLSQPLAFRHTLRGLQQGSRDPSATWVGEVFWRATRTPDGPCTSQIEKLNGSVRMRAWGPGSDWAATGLERLIGEEQDISSHGHPVIDEIHHRIPGVRVPASRSVLDAVVFTTLAQRVTSMEAVGAWRRLLWKFNARAPLVKGGPTLLLPATPEQLEGMTSWEFHNLNVERKRADTIRIAARCARRLEEACNLPADDATRRLIAIPGIGVWTAAEVAQVALGNVDAVSVGDFHVADHVGFALTGRARSTDEQMMELLAPFAPRRGLAAKLLLVGHRRPPAFGPRYSPLPISAM